MIRPGKGLRGAHGLAEPGHRAVARQDQMIAIVDHLAQLRIVIGPAAPARLRRGIADTHRQARLDEPHCRRQPGQPRPGYRRPGKAQRLTSSQRTVASRAILLVRGRVRGDCQPVRCMPRSSRA